MSARVDYSYVKTLAALAANPVKELSRFEEISPRHETVYSYDRLRVVIGIAAVVLSAGIAIKSVKISLAGFSIAALILYSSVSSEKVETEKFKAHKQAIEQFFAPLNEGFMHESEEKAQCITQTINGSTKASNVEVKQAIETIAQIYDGTKEADQYPDKLKYERKMDLENYTSLLNSARTLKARPASLLRDTAISLNCRNAFYSLRNRAIVFLDGNRRKDSEGEDAYLIYWCSDGKAQLGKFNPYMIII